MAWANSYVASATLRDSLKNAIALNIAGSSPDALFCALFNNTVTPSIDTDPQSYGVAPWNANEVFQATFYPAGGVQLASPTMTLTSGTGVTFSASAVSQATTTLTNVFGALIYDNTLSPKAAICAVYFGGTAYSTNNGTFGITWSGSGIFVLTLHP